MYLFFPELQPKYATHGLRACTKRQGIRKVSGKKKECRGSSILKVNAVERVLHSSPTCTLRIGVDVNVLLIQLFRFGYKSARSDATDGQQVTE
jgi:hypothetical protein